MTQVVIKIPGGDFDTGFPVVLEFWEDGRIIATDRDCPQLPAQPAIPQIYDKWQKIYRDLGERILEVPDAQITHKSTFEDCFKATQTLESTLETWFRKSAFGDIRGRIVGRLRDVAPNESVRIVLDTPNSYLRRLSWDQWDLFKEDHFLPNGELVLLSRYNRPPETLKTPIRILAIFGSDEGGLQLQEDLKEIQNLAEYGAEITCIPKRGNVLTSQELCDSLWLRNWDIIFYAGHSSGRTMPVAGTLNFDVSLLKDALKRAAPRVKLAIFNSCDGLGMAEYLAEFNIPHFIVMREPVPDAVARIFLKYFLAEFTQGKPLHAAVHNARQELHRIEVPTVNNEFYYPGASWLPILLQNPTAPQLYWPQPEPEPEKPLIQPKVMMMLGLLLIGVLIGIFWGTSTALFKKPAVIGDAISEGEEILMSNQRGKQQGVTWVANCQKPLHYFIPIWNAQIRQQWKDCFETKINYQQAAQNFKKSWQEEIKDPETLIYYNNALLEARGVDYYTIAVVVPILKNETGEVRDTENAQEILRGVAQIQTEINLSLLNGEESSDLALPGSDFLKSRDLNGKGLRVIISDDSNLEEKALNVAKSLVKKSEILGVVGHYSSEMTLKTVETYNHKLVLVSPGTTTSELTVQPQPFFFRTPSVTDLQAKAMVDHLMSDKINKKRVVVFYNPASPYSSDYQKQFRQQFTERGGTIIESINLAAPNFNAKSAIEKVQNSGETAIVLIPDGQVTNSVINSVEVIKENQGQNWIVGNWSVYTPKTLKIAQPELLEKLILVVHWNHLNSPQPDFSQAALQLWGGPVSPRTALAYDAAHVLIEGIRQNPTRKGIQKVLSSESFRVDGVTGKIEFKPGTGDRKEQPIDIVKVVACANQIFGVTFLPDKFSTPEEAGLNCSNRE
ncbi:ABC transporter substrate-binding protein [Limnoraphis robusta]|uniref:ABC transporter substrate-binding protein n=1 Tax=Limnoraphis robusta CCNP1315 TaxID=3110306 RepID=A0ABU5TTG8_9CYAN|nr:ABC transporter substrate-binding protein [Limnoraphis robusta]MEA5518185.1 ABC transporter substrate-binding protein [Limnoraphis robusta CCNP1315]MEA5543371.1 ABC transporter substrate-binding protein [Limnoraphis robusta CCNP1324]